MEMGSSVLWSIVPMEQVMEGFVVETAVAPRMEMSVAGRLLQVVPLANGLGRVERLISADPQDYLDSRWQPGAVVSLHIGP
jgi:hypothetical protein